MKRAEEKRRMGKTRQEGPRTGEREACVIGKGEEREGTKIERV